MAKIIPSAWLRTTMVSISVILRSAIFSLSVNSGGGASLFQHHQRCRGVLLDFENILAERAQLRRRLPQAFAELLLDVVLGELDVRLHRQRGRVLRHQRVRIRRYESAQALAIAFVGGESRVRHRKTSEKKDGSLHGVF
jgi:hypothetical protein